MVLDDEHIAFMSRDAISTAISTRNHSNRSAVSKGLAVRVRADRRTVEIFVDAERSTEVLNDVRAQSPVAVVCSEPSTHRTIQVKGPGAAIEMLAADEVQFVAGKVDALVKHIVPLGYADNAIRVYLTYTPSRLVKIVFPASAAFLQTPGPGAGAPIKP